MFISLPLLAIGGILVLLLLGALARSRTAARRDLMAPPPTVALTQDQRQQVHDMMITGNKIGAIGLVRELAKVDLRTAKDYVDRMTS